MFHASVLLLGVLPVVVRKNLGSGFDHATVVLYYVVVKVTKDTLYIA